MKFAVVVFPGSNCDHDAHYAAKHVLGQEAELVWHKDTSLGGADAVILPGGFAHGDYLRTGAIARFSPIMARVPALRRRRRPGARHLQRLPGAARGGPAAGRDAAQPRACTSAASTSTCASSRPTRRSRPPAAPGQVLRMPIAHGEGNYYAEPDVLDAARAQPAGAVPLRRRRRRRRPTTPIPNGSVNNIAGICNEARNVVGLMPHPERACELAVGSADGLVMLQSAVQCVERAHRQPRRRRESDAAAR